MQADRLQLALPFPHQPGYAAPDFLADESNRDAMAWIGRTPGWPDRRLALWGAAGRGKTHLLHIWAERQSGVLLAGPGLRDLGSIPLAGALALDDADTVLDETLLLHVLNTARDRGLAVLLSGRSAPARWPVRLPDLSSRLRAINAVEILPPGDALLRAMLTRIAADRQLKMPETVVDWLLPRLPRSAGAMREAVARLDRESLARGQAITRSLAARVLDMEELYCLEADEDSVVMQPASLSSAGFL
jgi:chromosomal replication initiation ATPase DnaA